MARGTAKVAIGLKFREMLKAQPFRPFVVTTVTGKKYQIPRGDYGIVSPGLTNVYFYDKKGHGHFFDTDYISKLDLLPKRKKKRTRS